MKFKNKKVLVYGLGDSGRAAARLLKNLGANIGLFDDDVKYFDQIGFERDPLARKWDLVVISPGIKCADNSVLKQLELRKIPIISELDLAYLCSSGRIVGVTGTNGKTTVCMLLAKIFKSAGLETFLCGNIGLPFSAVCEKTSESSVTVCEVSSFQLEKSSHFRGDVCAILNVQPDHLDRHGNMEEYVRAKAKIAAKMRRKDVLVLNLDDEQSRKMVCHKRFVFFSKNKMKRGVYVWKNQIYVGRKAVMSISDISLLGEKNLENVLAAVAIAWQFKVGVAAILSAVKSFVPASHRMELVGQLDGVTYIDDSKATNVASTVACVEAFKKQQIWLLLGGLGKDIDYKDLFEKNFQIKHVVAFGADREKIFESAKNFGYTVSKLEKFDDAVMFCKKNADEGDFVLLSPACASFDEFSSYAQRGEHFKNLILGSE